MSKFKIGDTVKLNSGSPLLTIIKIDLHNKVQVVWLHNDKAMTETIHEDCFTPVNIKKRKTNVPNKTRFS